MKHRSDAGFSLAALIFIATALSILASAAYPAYQLQAKRQTEEELMFRGEEYARAIQKFYRKFGVYPPTIDALVQTNGIRFLRKVYKDPITGKDFRTISIAPDGTLIGSSLPTQRINNTPLFGAPLQTFTGQPPGAGQPSGQGQPPAPGQPPPSTQPPAGSAPPTSGQRPPASPPAFSVGPSPSSPSTASQPRQPAAQPPQGTQPGSGFQQPAGGTFGSAGIVGVASDSTEISIKVYNQRQKYNEWEFIAIMAPTQPPGQGGGGTGGGAGSGAGTGTQPPPGTGTGTPPPGTFPPPGPSGTNPLSPFQAPSQPQPFKRP